MIGQTGLFNLVWQLVKEKGNYEIKSVKLHLKLSLCRIFQVRMDLGI